MAGYIGNYPTAVPLSSADLADNIITSAKIADGTITNADLASGVGGKVLQVVTYQDTSQRSTTSTSFVDVPSFQATITPSSVSNKILLLLSSSTGNNSTQETIFNIQRNGSNLANPQGFSYAYGNTFTYQHIHISYLDSPSSTSALTYKLQFRVGGGTGYANHSGTQGSITLIEIAG